MTSRFRRAFNGIYPFLARHRCAVALVVYGALTVAAFILAYLVRFEAALPSAHVTTMTWGLALLLPIRVASHLTFGVATSRWRYASISDLLRLVASVSVGSLAFTVIAWGVISSTPRIPLGVILIEWVLTTYFIAALWAAYRTAYEWMRHDRSRHGDAARRVLIVGAGEAGERLLRELRRAGEKRFVVVGFVDDDPLKQRASISGVEILGGLAAMGEVAERTDADEILVAMPSAGPRTLRKVVAACQKTRLPYRVLPGITAVLRGEVSLDQLREVRIDDLLGRDPIRLEVPELHADLADQVVFVTGAAGSIGSELCRQIARHSPRRLILLDQAESPLYFIDRELREDHPGLDLVPVVGDVRDREDLARVFRTHAPARVFHAAAYKHVPLMEAHVRRAIENNVLGTRNVIAASARAGVEKFVLISTDKAVRPSSVMGATKRAAEILLLQAASEWRETKWYAVRFGNVLGSAGSVIPLFRKQLEEGRPLTVTHEAVTRYFMTIPEAVQLVLQTALLEIARDRIAMLDMGEPVRIIDLARDLIRLSGRIEGVDAEIRITGLRPGEKLHEELAAPTEHAVPTEIDKIQVLLQETGVLPDPLAWLCPRGEVELATCSDEELRDRLMRLASASHALQISARTASA
ncbi:MAG: nucleoside-diphosphate sugar epimerase/dehydratase [Longimicrobiales bacterium]|nr:nucleoside-diphosphate sugar epimerase/dehydratase [Longimicrobiales bacterium]